MKRVIERYQKGAIVFHWAHSVTFVILILTGGFLFLPGIGISSAGYGIGILHRIAAVIFVALSVGYAIHNPGKASTFLRETFNWRKDDLRWFMTAPHYYFGGPAESMPRQGYINTGQKLWQVVIIATGIGFLVTGTILWFFRSAIDPAVYQWVLFVHGMAFVIIFAMFLIHIYMGVFHPRSNESLRAMLDGKVSEPYARSHYRGWYDSKMGNLK